MANSYARGWYKKGGLWRLPVKRLSPTRNELEGYLDHDAKDVFAVNAKALTKRVCLAFLQKVSTELDMDELSSATQSTLQLYFAGLCKNARHTRTKRDENGVARRQEEARRR